MLPGGPAGPAGVVAITGHKEALAAYKDPAFSSANSVVGPFAPLPFEPEGDDISELLELHRGAPGARNYSYEPTFIMRGLTDLHIEFTPIT